METNKDNNMQRMPDPDIITEILDSGSSDDGGVGRMLEDTLIIDEDENGEKWCTLKIASKITGYSVSKLRKDVTQGKLTKKMVDGVYGDTYYVKYDEVVALGNVKQMQMAHKNAANADVAISVFQALQEYQQKYIEPLAERLDVMEEAQAAKMLADESLSKELKDSVSALVEENKKMSEAMEALQKIIYEQQEYIEAEKNKSFFQRLFGK